MRQTPVANARREVLPADPVKVLTDTRRTLLKLVANIDEALRACADSQNHEDDRSRVAG